MKIFKNKKIMYLIVLCIITLLAFVVSPTYAKFVDTYVTENDMVEMDLSFNMSITEIDEYHEIVVAAGETTSFNVQIDNDSSETTYYGVWYKMVNPSTIDEGVSIGRLDGTEVATSGSIDSSGSKTVAVGIINDSTSDIRLYIGVASSTTSTNDIEYLDGKQLIAGDIDLYKPNAYAENVMIPNAVSDENIDFSQTSEASGTNGIYLMSSTADDTYPIYYYRGQVDNNLIFANTCWKIVRTTETGGLKLLYNGTPTDGQCTGSSPTLGSKAFNSSYRSPAYVGYMYSSPYAYSSQSMSSVTDTYYYGNDVTYADGTYTLTDTISSSSWSSIYNGGLNNNHYRCPDKNTTTCDSVYYIYYTSSSTAYYITLTGGKKVEDALTEMLGADDANTANYNTTSSTIKGNNTTSGTLDYWYYTNIEQGGYSSYVEDTVWCSDRTISSLNGWDPDGGSTRSYLYFSTYNRVYTTASPSLTCTRNIDSFTVSEENGNGDLDYPVGLLTADEIMLAGADNQWSENSSYYLYTGDYYWAVSPVVFGNYVANVSFVGYDGGLSGDSVGTDFGVRPSISLKPGFSLTGNGDGTTANPYVVN